MVRPGLKARALIALLAFLWAAPLPGAAHSAGRMWAKLALSATAESSNTLPRPVRLRDVGGRGLLVNVWINSSGPYVFAVDTGAGATLVRFELLRMAGLSGTTGASIEIGGLSKAKAVSAGQIMINKFALGDRDNLFPNRQKALVVSNLPRGIDGILDPTEAYEPLGYVIDIPKRQLLPFDTSTNRLRVGDDPLGGAIVRWVRETGGTRPFVRLGDNRLALIDTGSGLGLAISQPPTVPQVNQRGRAVRDLGGGTVESRRVEPTTVTIGSLVLRRVPTDILIGTHEDVPVLLGRGALYPFRLTFDPASRLIEIVPSDRS